MDLSRLHCVSNWAWRLDPEGETRVPAVLYRDDSTAVVEAAHLAGLSCKVVTLEPVICIKG